MAGSFRELKDEFYKTTYLPEFSRRAAAIRGGRRTDPNDQGRAAGVLSPESDCNLACDRYRIAARPAGCGFAQWSSHCGLYAASRDRALPESLSQISEVPVPDDPATGKPFEYVLTGKSALVSARAGWAFHTLAVIQDHDAAVNRIF